jgi:hypothetical protein
VADTGLTLDRPGVRLPRRLVPTQAACNWSSVRVLNSTYSNSSAISRVPFQRVEHRILDAGFDTQYASCVSRFVPAVRTSGHVLSHGLLLDSAAGHGRPCECVYTGKSTTNLHHRRTAAARRDGRHLCVRLPHRCYAVIDSWWYWGWSPYIFTMLYTIYKHLTLMSNVRSGGVLHIQPTWQTQTR